jgi:hypothetical protein
MAQSIGTVTLTTTVKIKLDISFWDALKMRLMGRRPAAILLWRMVKMMKTDAT